MKWNRYFRIQWDHAKRSRIDSLALTDFSKKNWGSNISKIRTSAFFIQFGWNQVRLSLVWSGEVEEGKEKEEEEEEEDENEEEEEEEEASWDGKKKERIVDSEQEIRF